MKILFSNKKKASQIKDKNTGVVEITEATSPEVFRTSSGQKKLILGVGKLKEVNLRRIHLIARQIISFARAHRIKKLALTIDEFRFPSVKISDFELGQILAAGFGMANFEFVKFKTEPKEGWNFVVNITICGKVSPEFKKGIAAGEIIANEVNATRILANTPGGEMTPILLAEAAKVAVKSIGAGPKIDVKVLGRKEMKKLGMEAILGVAKGSSEEPQFIVMEYFGAEKTERPVVLVGKGVTFDTGGLNLKPSDSMYTMHMDMSGGAAVIHAVVLAAKLKLPKNIIGLVPAVENMPSGSSYRPGDILSSMSGKTIEVLNTDAEGRVILADGLYYAGKMYNPRLVVDVATLTGAAMVAFGNRASAVFTKDEGLERTLREIGEKTGDYVWPMPLWDEYEADIKGTFGDWANLGKGGQRGGAIFGAMFLYQFTKEYPKDCKWAHIDMAPRMTATDDEFLAKGAVGAPVRLLVELLKDY